MGDEVMPVTSWDVRSWSYDPLEPRPTQPSVTGAGPRPPVDTTHEPPVDVCCYLIGGPHHGQYLLTDDPLVTYPSLDLPGLVSVHWRDARIGQNGKVLRYGEYQLVHTEPAGPDSDRALYLYLWRAK